MASLMLLTRMKPEAIPSTSSTLHEKKAPESIIGKLSCMLLPRKPETKPLLRVPALSVDTKPDEIERLFRCFDEDRDGKMSPAELRNCIRTVGEELSVVDAEAVVECTDTDGDGLLCYDDFVKLVGSEGEEEKGRNLRAAFGVYEMEGQDCITPKSLNRVLSRLGESRTMEECAHMIQRFDLDGDGVISFDEFMIMMH